MAERKVDIQGHSYTVREPTPKASPHMEQPSAPSPQPQNNLVTSESNMNVNIPHGNRTVFMAMLVSFGTFALAGQQGVAKLAKLQSYLGGSGGTGASGATTAIADNALGGGSGSTTLSGSVFTPRAIFGWLTLFVILTVMADFDATSDLAGAFAMLIMFSTLLVMGPEALTNLSKLTTISKTG